MKNNSLNVGIIGAGNIGTKRVQAILDLQTDSILAVYDINLEKAKALADTCGAGLVKNVEEILNNPNIDCVVVSTTTDVSLKLVLKALVANKHVLVEKPLGSTKAEAEKVALFAKKSKKLVKVGFNHRHHPAVFKAHELVESGIIGKILNIRSVYGHGARPGYDTEWRMQKKVSPGGELFDQGVHIIDLAFWFLGKFNSVYCQTRNMYWKKSNLEDNAFCHLYTSKKQIVNFHVSLTQWKNRFTFEIYGDKGYVLINGLGKSYGLETLVLGTDVGQGRAPQEQIFEFAGEDISWKEEWKEFSQAISEKRQPFASAKDNVEVCKTLEALYISAKLNKILKIK